MTFRRSSNAIAASGTPRWLLYFATFAWLYRAFVRPGASETPIEWVAGLLLLAPIGMFLLDGVCGWLEFGWRARPIPTLADFIACFRRLTALEPDRTCCSEIELAIFVISLSAVVWFSDHMTLCPIVCWLLVGVSWLVARGRTRRAGPIHHAT